MKYFYFNNIINAITLIWLVDQTKTLTMHFNQSFFEIFVLLLEFNLYPLSNYLLEIYSWLKFIQKLIQIYVGFTS